MPITTTYSGTVTDLRSDADPGAVPPDPGTFVALQFRPADDPDGRIELNLAARKSELAGVAPDAPITITVTIG